MSLIKNLLLFCNVCDKQYIGETTDNFRLRWNNCKCNARKFMSEGHTGFVNDVSVTFIDKTDGSNPKQRKLLNENLENDGT